MAPFATLLVASLARVFGTLTGEAAASLVRHKSMVAHVPHLRANAADFPVSLRHGEDEVSVRPALSPKPLLPEKAFWDLKEVGAV